MKAEQTEEPREASVGPVGHKLCYRPGNESGELLSYGAEEAKGRAMCWHPIMGFVIVMQLQMEEAMMPPLAERRPHQISVYEYFRVPEAVPGRLLCAL